MVLLNPEDGTENLNLEALDDGWVKIFRNGVLIAYAIVELDLGEDFVYLSSLKVVKKEDRGRGLGKMLLATVNGLIKESLKVGELDVGVENVIAQRLYLGGGWKYVNKEEVDEKKRKGLGVSYYKMEYTPEG